MQSNLARPPCWHPPSGPDPPRFERSDHNHTQGISQPEPYDDVIQYPETPQEEAGVLFHLTHWPPRQAPMYQEVQSYSLDPFAGTSSVENPAMRQALTYNGPSFSEDLVNLDGPYAYNGIPPRNTMEYPEETFRTVNQVCRENIAFPTPPLPRPAAYNAHLIPEVFPNNGFSVHPESLGPDSIPFLPAYQRDFRRNSAIGPPDSRGTSYTNTMNRLAHQIYSEDTTSLVQPPAVLIPPDYGESVSNENGTSPEFVQWLKSINKNNPTKNGYPYTPEGYGEPNSLRGIEEGIQSSPETTLASLSPTLSPEASNTSNFTARHYAAGPSCLTPSRGLQAQPGRRRIVPYPATSQAKEEPQLKNSKKIIPLSLLEAVALFGPKMRECWGTRGQKNLDALLWETRSAVEGEGSVKKRSKCKICDTMCSGSAALYHARKHLNINTHPCQYKDCPESFAQSSDRKNHMERVHQKHLDQPSTPPTSSQDPLNILYHG